MSIWGNDLNLIYSNPALLNHSMVNQAVLNYCNFVGDINYFNAGTAYSLKDRGMTAISLQSFNYGAFAGYDEFGNKTRNFNAADYSLNLNYAKPFADSMFNVGLCLKTIYSQYDTYKSFGNALDFGVTYHTKQNFVLSLLIKNVGTIWKTYSNYNVDNSLPNTVQLGMSYKPKHAPFRFFVVYDQLLKWNLKYISPVDTTGKSASLGSSDTKQDSTGFQKFGKRFGSLADNFMRHINFGAEILFSKNFVVRVAYNYRRQVEMTLPDIRGANGLSFGAELKVKRFSYSYAFSKTAFPGYSNIIGLAFRW